METPPLEVRLTKIEGARENINAAIVMWLHGAHPAVIVTIISAGHQVCNDLTGKESPFLLNPALVSKADWEGYRKTICKAENFLKHATGKYGDCDPEAVLTINLNLVELYILDAIELYKAVCGTHTDLMRAFRYRFTLLHPESFPEFDPAAHIPDSIHASRLSKVDFLNATLESIARQRAAGLLM